MPETPFEFYVDNAVIVARINMPDVDTKFLIAYGECSELNQQYAKAFQKVWTHRKELA